MTIPSVPFKTYNVTRESKFSNKRMTIDQNGATVLWIETHASIFEKPEVQLKGAPTAAPLAAAKLKGFSSGVRIVLGDPKATPKERWTEVNRDGFTAKQYSFVVAGRRLMWRRTHNQDLGAASYGSQDYKLLDAADDRNVLAAYLKDREILSGDKIGRVDWFTDMGQDTELLVLAAILGIEERLRRARNARGAAASGAGAGA